MNDLLTLINNSQSGAPDLIAELEQRETVLTGLPESWQKQADFVSEWIDLEPKFSGVDLRPITYLTRELKPVRVSAVGLSVAGETALRILLKSERATSPAVAKVIGTLVPSERELVMDAVVDALSKESDWARQPRGFSGALALSAADAECGRKLATHIRSLRLSKMPGWLKASLKDRLWWTD